MLVFSEKKIYFLLFAMIPLFFQLQQYVDFPFDDIPLFQYIPYLLIFFFSFITKKLFVINKTKKAMLFGTVLFFNYLFFHIIFFNFEQRFLNQSIQYLVLIFLTYYTIVKVSLFIKNEEDLKKTIWYFFVGNSIVLIIAMIINFEELMNINNYLSILTGQRTSRAWLGFGHPNTTGMYLFLNSIICFYFAIVSNKKYSWIIMHIIFFIAMLATGSRTVFYGLIVIYIFFLYKTILIRFSIKVRYGIIVIIIPIATLLLGITFIELWDLASGRNELMQLNMQNLIETGNLFSGYGPINYTSLGDFFSIYTSDNWYVTNTLSNGIISTAFFAAYIIFLFKQEKDVFLKSIIISVLIMSLFENVLFNNGISLTSFVYVIVLRFFNEAKR